MGSASEGRTGARATGCRLIDGEDELFKGGGVFRRAGFGIGHFPASAESSSGESGQLATNDKVGWGFGFRKEGNGRSDCRSRIVSAG